MDLGLKNKVAMVAGASKGIGYAVAKILIQEGACVSIASRDTNSIQAAGERLRADGGEVLAVTADVRSAQALEQWRDATLKSYGGIDLAFVNSGGPPAGGFLTFDDAAWQEAINLLILNAVRISRLVLPSMISRGAGSIVFSTSSSVKEPIPNLTLSNVLRGSVSALAKTLAREFAAEHVRVNQAIPGRIDTDRLRELDTINARKLNMTPEQQKTQMIANIPMGRYGTADEFARGVVFLLSDAASFITGATLQIDGGMIRSVV